MRKSTVKRKLSKDQPVLLTTLHFDEPNLFELAGLMGFDGLWIDLEHHGRTVERARELMRASRVGNTDIMARPARGEFMRLGRCLEAGATGILYPRCADSKEAAEVVRAAKFHPLGERGFDGGQQDAPYCSMPLKEYLRQANEETFIGIQIEDDSALEEAQAIAAVDGVDFIFLGPGDFSIFGGIAGEFDHPKVQAAVEHVARAAKESGKHWGMPSASVERTRELLDMGARVICHNADVIILKNAFEQMQRDFAPLGFSFDNRLGS